MSTRSSPHLPAWRLFSKFLLILVPIFILASYAGLSLIADYKAQQRHNQISARIGALSGHVATSLSRPSAVEETPFARDLLTTLLHDPAILCAEVTHASGSDRTLMAPHGLGCKGQENADFFEIPIGRNGAQLHIRFGTDEVDAARTAYRDFSMLAMFVGLFVAVCASALGFRLNIGNPLGVLLTAIRLSGTEHRPVIVPVSGNDELSAVIRAYNQMQRNLAKEADRVRTKSAELSAQRHRNEALLSKVFQVSPFPFAILDLDDGTYHNVNEAWLSTMGFDRDEVIGNTAGRLEIWPNADRRAEFIGLCREHGSVQAFETKVQTKAGRELDVLIYGEIVDIDGDIRLFMVADDQTELKIAQETSLQQERLATLGQLTATVSHELRNPLAAIRSSVHLAIQKTKGSELGIDRSLQRAERNVIRCDDIISDLLGHASEPVCEPEEIRGDDWLRETIADLEVPQNIQLVKRMGASDAMFRAAPERIRQAVVNIFENAIQALSDMPDDQTKVLTVATSAEMETYTIAFQDNGPGMDPGLVAKAFEPLFSTKSYGCGLGLATAKKITERYGGAITCESEAGHGTRIAITFPLQPAQERAA